MSETRLPAITCLVIIQHVGPAYPGHAGPRRIVNHAAALAAELQQRAEEGVEQRASEAAGDAEEEHAAGAPAAGGCGGEDGADGGAAGGARESADDGEAAVGAARDAAEGGDEERGCEDLVAEGCAELRGPGVAAATGIVSDKRGREHESMLWVVCHEEEDGGDCAGKAIREYLDIISLTSDFIFRIDFHFVFRSQLGKYG